MSGPAIIVVGGGMAGLTAGVYLARSGFRVTLLERNERCGGLVGSFEREGFTFDAGPRAVGDAGILTPMLRDLDIDLPLVQGLVSTGIAGEITHYDDESGIEAFFETLRRFFPGSLRDISAVERRIRKSCRMARILNRLPNPVFKDPMGDPAYLFTRFLPWLPSFFSSVLYELRHHRPVEKVLERLTGNRSLQDMVCQHFFKGTPERFAFGYFENFMDYRYPLGGTGRLPETLERKFTEFGGSVTYGAEAVRIDAGSRRIIDAKGRMFPYDALIWAADLKSLYRRLDCSLLPPRVQARIRREGDRFLAVPPGESVLSLFLGVDENPEKFRKISRGHFIYTPSARGLGNLRGERLEVLKAEFSDVTEEEFFAWLKEYCGKNSLEISIPVLKDSSLAPPGKTGIEVSILFDGAIALLAERRGWMDEFRERAADALIDALNGSVYPGLRGKILFRSIATPLSIASRFLTDGGAITGWSLESKVPVPSSLPGVFSAVRTGIPRVWKAGQWSFSPSGVPIAILTGKIAASAAERSLTRGASREGRR